MLYDQRAIHCSTIQEKMPKQIGEGSPPARHLGRGQDQAVTDIPRGAMQSYLPGIDTTNFNGPTGAILVGSVGGERHGDDGR